MNSEQYLKFKNMRKQYLNEIIIDIDDRTEHGLLCFMQTGINLVNNGYNIEIWYATGMKNPHIHIKNILSLDGLNKEEGTRYRKLFFERYIPKDFWRVNRLSEDVGAIPDYSIAESYENAYHPIAEENKPHYKYKTIKLLRSNFNKNAINQIEIDLWDKAKLPELPKLSIACKSIKEEHFKTLARKIAGKISIIVIADQFGLTPLSKKSRICPFHSDSNPSLSLKEDLGLFNCFGCHASGNIIKFYAMLKKLNPSFEVLNGALI